MAMLSGTVFAQYTSPSLSKPAEKKKSSTPNIEKNEDKDEYQDSDVKQSGKYQIGVTFAPAFSTLLFSPVNAKKGGGWIGGHAGLDYAHKINDDGKWWWSIGAKWALYYANTTFSGSVVADNLIDYSNDNALYRLTTNFENLKESQRIMTLGLPIGFYWMYDKITIGGGIELATIVRSKYKLINGSCNTSYYAYDLDVEFDNFNGDHGVGPVAIEQTKQTLDLNRFALLPFVDVAYNLNDKLSIGCYVSVDLNNLYLKDNYGNKDLISIIDDKASYSGVLHSNQVAAARLFSAGIKLRWAIKEGYQETEKSTTKFDPILLPAPESNNEDETKEDSVPKETYGDIDFEKIDFENMEKAIINSILILLDHRYDQKAISRAIQLYDEALSTKSIGKEYKPSRDALSNYEDTYNAYAKIICDARREVTKIGTQTAVAVSLKKQIEHTTYWEKRDTYDKKCRYHHLENVLDKIMRLVNDYLVEGQRKISGNEFKNRFLEISSEFEEE